MTEINLHSLVGTPLRLHMSQIILVQHKLRIEKILKVIWNVVGGSWMWGDRTPKIPLFDNEIEIWSDIPLCTATYRKLRRTAIASITNSILKDLLWITPHRTSFCDLIQSVSRKEISNVTFVTRFPHDDLISALGVHRNSKANQTLLEIPYKH